MRFPGKEVMRHKKHEKREDWWRHCCVFVGLCEDLDESEMEGENEAGNDESEPEYLHEPSKRGQKSGYFKVSGHFRC